MSEIATEEVEKTEEQVEREFEILATMFPSRSITVCIDLEEINDLITTEKRMVVKQDFLCYCHQLRPRKTKFYVITGEQLTYKYVIQKLLKKGFRSYCNHHFLEYFQKETEVQYGIGFGS